MPSSDPSTSLAAARIEVIQQSRRYKRRHLREFITRDYWYPWQLEYLNAPEPNVMLMAGNQSGKTEVCCFKTALHATGDYPDYYEGQRCAHAGVGWILGVDSTQLKDVLQAKLIGEFDPDAGIFHGGGYIHPDEIVGYVRHQAVKGLLSEIKVRHRSRRTSVLKLKTYTQAATGQASLPFASAKVDHIQIDEQPPDELQGQLSVRRAMGRKGQGGLMGMGMTPELGLTELIRKYMEEPAEGVQRLIGPIGWDEVPHMTPEKQALLLADIPQHEHDMRRLGVPFFGSGLVYPIGEGAIRCEPFVLPPYFTHLAGCDIGIQHPFAWAWLAYDPEDDVIYLYDGYEQSGSLGIATHASAYKKKHSAEIPVAVPHDADSRRIARTDDDIATVATMLQDEGLDTIPFKMPDGTIYVEPGILWLYERMRTGRFKAFRTVEPFWRGIRRYHRKDGKIVKVNDDFMDAVRVGANMIVDHGVRLGETEVPRVIGNI